ncbi:MAG: CPBP family intramembrane metalloprotease [Clostridia bacterium]|nr:CPBP family intramembrane metalloprotease [Clostridia bacterium]
MEDKSLKSKIHNEWKNINQNSDRVFNLALIFVCIILFVYCYLGSFSFFEKAFYNVVNLQYVKIIYHNMMSFVLFFVIGLIYTKFVIKSNPSDFGLKLENKKLGIILVLIAIPICALCGLSCVLDEGMKATYPLIDFNIYSSWYFIVAYFTSYFLYYIGWEYLFRGLLLNSSEKKLGAVGAILLSTLISALIHTSIAGFGKPMIETLSAIPAGLIFGYIAHKTKSIYPTLLIHFFVGFFTDLFIFLIA